MRKHNFISMSMLLLAAGMSMTACSVSDNEKSPEVVEDPIKDAVEYYISGKVSTDIGAVNGIKVFVEGAEPTTTDATGKFKITVTEKGNYLVTAEKEGYLPAGAHVTIAQNASNRSSQSVSLHITKTQDAVVAEKEKEIVVTAGKKVANLESIEQAGVQIPGNNITETSQVAVTPYVASQNELEGSKKASVMSVAVTTDKNIPADGTIIAIKNPATKGTYLKNIKVYRVDGKTRAAKEYEATYNETNNTYECKPTDGTLAGNYAFAIEPKKSSKPGEALELGKGKVDNSGNFEAKKDVTITFPATLGWSYTTSPASALQGADKELASLLENAVASREGAEGTYETSYSYTTNVGGNCIMYWNAKGVNEDVTYTFDLSSGKQAKVELQKYSGVNFSYVNESANQHSGGSSNGN